MPEGTEATPDTGITTGDPTIDPPASNVTPATGDDLAAELEKWKAQARKHEERAKANANAAKELEELKRSAMSDQEKAIDAARAQARAETLAEFGGRLVGAEIKAAAAGRLAPEQLDTLVSAIDAKSFLGDDGSVNGDAVRAFVDGFAPPPQPGQPRQPDLGQGARGGSNQMPLNGDPIENSLRQALGIR